MTDDHRNFYGRRHGKTLRPAQRGYLTDDLPRLALTGVTRDENPARTPIPLPEGELWLEVGYGAGEHMVAMALAHPEVTLLGAEPFLNGTAQALHNIRAAGVTNLRLHPGDARDLLDVIPPGRLSRAFLNYPDPWPKARHHRRRFVTPEHLHPLAAALAPGAAFHVASDIPDYLRQAREEVPPAGFALENDSPTPWTSWPSTRYEQKALREGRTPHYLTFRRL